MSMSMSTPRRQVLSFLLLATVVTSCDGATGTLPKERQSQEHHERSLGVGPHTFILGEEDQLQDTPRADAALVVGGSTSPSPRCARREEWRGPCYAWSGASHNRYLRILPLKPREGMGANLMRVASMLNRAILFDLEPIFVGPLVAGHDVGDFGPWIGLVDNPAMAVRDPAGYERAVVQHVPESVQSDYTWLHERQQDTSVIFEIDPNAARKIKDWGIPVSPLPSDPHVCSYVAQALRGAFWSVPSQRSRCRPYLSESRDQTGGGRPWVIAVHVRRGDMIRFRGGARSMPHAYFVAAVRSVLLGIAASAPGTQVTLLIFTESRMTLGENQLLQEDGKVVTWDIARESCEEIGLNCSQNIIVGGPLFDAFDCLATADVVIGSESSLSEAAAAMSTNVKVMVWEGQTEQDRVTLDPASVALNASVSPAKQSEMNAVISDWWHCAAEASQTAREDDVGVFASKFYQTVDE